MKKHNEEAAEASTINQDTKNEIQELFEDIFLRQLYEKLRLIGDKAEDNAGKIDKIMQEEQKHYLVVSDTVDKLKDQTLCLGKEQEWGDSTLLSALNTFIDYIGNEIGKIANQIGLWEEDDKQTSKGVSQALKEITKSISILNDTLNEIQEQGTKQREIDFGKIYNELRQIDGIIGKLSIIETEVAKAERSTEATEKHKEIIEREGTILKQIEVCVNEIKLVNDSCSDLRNDLLRFNESNEECSEKYKNEIMESIKPIEICQASVTKVAEEIERMAESYDKKVNIIYLGLGIMGVMNIVTIILLLVK